MSEREFAVKFARMVLKAQDIHEESWDAKKEVYTKDHHQSVKEARSQLGANDMVNVAYLLNITCWNDIQNWAAGMVQ